MNLAQRSPTVITEQAPAKVNLALHVVGRRPDGYHRLESLVVFTEVADTVTVSPAPADAFTVEGPFSAGLPFDDGNLVLKATAAIRRYVSDREARSETAAAPAGGPVAITLTKNLPVASGIGGGSSDAAATLRALNRLWNAGLPLDRLAECGKTLGADVPMCIHVEPLLARGVGEEIEPVRGFPSMALVLVNPGVPVATPAVFGALASRSNPALPPLPPQWTADALHHWLTATRNDLQSPAIALAPVIAEALGELERAGASLARMSGSGATCFGWFPTRAQAERAAGAIADRRAAWWVKATGTKPSPLPGTPPPGPSA